MKKLFRPRFDIFVLFMLVVAIALPAAGCKHKSPEPGPNEVWIIGWNFIPGTLNITAGTTVTWKNTTLDFHQVDSDTNLFHGRLDAGQTFQFTFTDPGTYSYHDESTDPPATGTIFVR